MKSFLVQPFHQRVYVSQDPAAFSSKVNKYAPADEQMEAKELDDCRGMAVHLCKDGKVALFMLYLRNDYDDTTLFHECLHLAHYMMDYCSAPISMESTELQAYLMEHIAATTRKKLK